MSCLPSSLIMLLLFGGGALAQVSQAPLAGNVPAPPPGRERPAQPLQQPLCDNDCIRRSADRAVQACAPQIEAQAPGDYEWLYRPYGGIFQEANSPEQPNSPIVRYRGDSIRFLSPQKEWVRAIYECGFDTARQAVASVSVKLGVRGKANAVPVLPQQAQARTVQGQAPAGQAAAGAPQALAPTSDRRRVGEVDQVSVLQINPVLRP